MELNVNIKISAEEVCTLVKAMRKERKRQDQQIREDRRRRAAYKTEAKKKYNELKMLEKRITDLKKEL